MSWAYSSRSLQRLQSCHPDLILLMTEALADPACPSDISILEGYRDEAKQNELKASGASQLSWPNSYHNRFPSMEQGKVGAGHRLEWGGDWTFKDGPHWQLVAVDG
jgi:hypothetical protein